MPDNNRFYICEHCGNLIALVQDAGVPMMCCGQKMTKLEPGTVEASEEKHVPVLDVQENTVTVTVGAIEHPMTAEHSIQWVFLQTDRGAQCRKLNAGDTPVATFALCEGEKVISAYAYCNLHGLWKTEYEEPVICTLSPVDTKATQNYQVCNCNNVSYFDILDAIQSSKKLETLLDTFESVKNTTKCTTGCGGCYDKVLQIISDVMANGEAQ
ncbi:MAG: hypothetical protein E7624_02900 [Ruminococcaceae bacterium]|nr:hypothetical protein [Oscillospiraceae bacterium]